MESSIKVEKIHVLSDAKKGTLAYVDISHHDDLIVKGLRVCTGSNGLFVSFPQTKGKNKEEKDEYYNNAYFKNKESDKAMQAVVLKAYEEKTQKKD